MKLGLGKYNFSSDIRNFIIHITYCSLMFFIAYTSCVCKTSENCKSVILQDKCNIEIFLSPASKSLFQ